MNRATPRRPPSPAVTPGIFKTNRASAQTVRKVAICTQNERMTATGNKSIQGAFCSLAAAEPQETRTVEFTKGPNDTLGISIAGGVGSPLGDIPIFIAMMNPVGLAAQTQKLKVRKSTTPASPGRGSGVCCPERHGDNSASVWLGWDSRCCNATNCGINIIERTDRLYRHN